MRACSRNNDDEEGDDDEGDDDEGDDDDGDDNNEAIASVTQIN